jgi:hypothetical protein
MPGLYTILPLAWIILLLAFGTGRRAMAGKPFFPAVPADARYGEVACSGGGSGSVWRRMFGASRCLVVAVTRHGGDPARLIVAPAFPFSVLPLPGFAALDIDVPLSALARVTPGRRGIQPALRIEFHDRPAIDLIVADEIALVAALGPVPVQIAEGKRPLQKAGESLARRKRFARALICAWGMIALLIGGTGLVSDLTVRLHGLSTTGTLVGFAGKQGVVRYRAQGIDYTLMSSFGPGTWKPGDTETVIYLKDDPSRTIEGSSLVALSGMTLLGLVVALAGLFGARIIPGWQVPPTARQP